MAPGGFGRPRHLPIQPPQRPLARSGPPHPREPWVGSQHPSLLPHPSTLIFKLAAKQTRVIFAARPLPSLQPTTVGGDTGDAGPPPAPPGGTPRAPCTVTAPHPIPGKSSGRYKTGPPRAGEHRAEPLPRRPAGPRSPGIPPVPRGGTANRPAAWQRGGLRRWAWLRDTLPPCSRL